MRVLLVDDQALFLSGLRHLVEASGHTVVGTAEDGLEALVKARALQPDVILMDLHMPVCDGLEATRRIREAMPDARVVILSASSDDEDLFEALRSGASGYLVKSLDGNAFNSLLSRLESGDTPFAPGLMPRILAEFSRSRPSSVASLPIEGEEDDRLSPRQKEVLTMVAQGITYKEIGARLYLSLSTVKYHMAEILDRLQVSHRAEAIAYAQRTGLVRHDGGTDDGWRAAC